MDYRIEVNCKQIAKEELLSCYLNPGSVSEACRLCPDYGKVWSCPPGVPDAAAYLEAYKGCFLIAVKVIYSKETLAAADSAKKAAEIRLRSYEKVKRNLLITLLALEGHVPGGLCIGAGRCILCEKCAREDGRACRYPDWRRYSITAFGFAFAKLLKDKMNLSLLWSQDGLPEYDTAVAALFYQ